MNGTPIQACTAGGISPKGNSMIHYLNLSAVGLFGMILSASFCDILWTKKKRLIMGISIVSILLLQGVIFFLINADIVELLYPVITHLPLIAVLCLLRKKYLWPTVSVLTAYLCCQLRRWLALLIVALFSGTTAMQDTAELILTLPILVLMLRYIAPAVCSVARRSAAIQWQFGLVPALYYGFDYLTRIYTNLLLKGSLVILEFMPFVCSVAYLVFILRFSAEGRVRTSLEQTKQILDLQVSQAVREIQTLRDSQRKTRIYHHDLRHHMQYISACIENGQYDQAREYIRGVCSEIEEAKITVYCENEAVNLIFSSFVKRAKDSDIPIDITARISHKIPVSENDMCVLLSNALENALHACQERKKKGLPASIKAYVYEKNGNFFFQFVNSCEDNILFDHGIPVAVEQGHGIGVRSICAIVEKYQGTYTFSVKEHQFILQISF